MSIKILAALEIKDKTITLQHHPEMKMEKIVSICIKDEEGNFFYYDRHGKLDNRFFSNEKNPAVIYADGCKEYWSSGVIQTNDSEKPFIGDSNMKDIESINIITNVSSVDTKMEGSFWFNKEGKLHLIYHNQPAVVLHGKLEHWINGEMIKEVTILKSL